jgi:TIR domain-containing protein/restriction endonuclease
MVDNSTDLRRPQAFISYAQADRDTARRIADALKSAGLRVWFSEWELQPGDSIARRIDEALSASDVLLVLLSPNAISSNWVQSEWRTAVSSQLSNRAVTVIPILIEDCKVPPPLSHLAYLDLRHNFDAGVHRLIDQLGMVSDVDFSILSNETEFSSVVCELLLDMGFNIVQRHAGPQELGYDLEATYEAVDPLGGTMTQTWLIELKFYRKSRVDLRAIEHLVAGVTRFPTSHKGLLITNGQLTSIARSHLAEASERSRVELRVIDGTELRRLLLDRPKIVRKYFAGDTTHDREE